MYAAWIARAAAALGLLALSVAALGRRGNTRWAAATQVLLKRLEDSRLPATALRYHASELDGLPAPVQRYFRTVLQDGQPIIAGVTVHHSGTFNVSANGDRWMPFTSRQRVQTRRPGFVWNARISVVPGIHIAVHDAYVAGVGNLNASLLGLFTLAKLEGPGEIARGELVRYLAEGVWYPTALLPSQGVCWTAIDDCSARATLVDDAVGLTARFMFDSEGLVESVDVEARGAAVGGAIVMTPWEGRMSNYQWRNGMLVPLTCEAAWLPPGERKPYWRGAIISIAHDFSDEHGIYRTPQRPGRFGPVPESHHKIGSL